MVDLRRNMQSQRTEETIKSKEGRNKQIHSILFRLLWNIHHFTEQKAEVVLTFWLPPLP